MKAMFLIVGPAVFGSILIVGIASNGVDEVKVPSVQSGKHVSPGYRSDWTHKELIAHFRSSGMDVVSTSAGGLSVFIGKPTDIEEFSDARMGTVFMKSSMSIDWLKSQYHLIRVDLLPTEVVAREAAGTLGDNGFAWHRFLFRGRPDLLMKYRSIL